MEEEKRKAYSEVVEILKLIEDEEKMEKIPFEVIELIKNNADPTYKPEISKSIPFEEQNLNKQTYAILGWIAKKYWNVDTIEEDNTEKIEQEVIDKPEVRNAAVFNDIEPETLEKVQNIENKDNLPALYETMNFYEKIFHKVIDFFKKLFKIKEKKLNEGELE